MPQLLQPTTLHGWNQELFPLVRSISPIFHFFRGLLFLQLEVSNRKHDELVIFGRMSALRTLPEYLWEGV